MSGHELKPSTFRVAQIFDIFLGPRMLFTKVRLVAVMHNLGKLCLGGI